MFFFRKSRAQFIKWLDSKIIAYNRKQELDEPVPLIPAPAVRFSISVNEDLEGYTFLIAHSMRKAIREQLDGTKEAVAAEWVKIDAILDSHGPRLKEYLAPYRNLKTDQVTMTENHRVFAAHAVFDPARANK